MLAICSVCKTPGSAREGRARHSNAPPAGRAPHRRPGPGLGALRSSERVDVPEYDQPCGAGSNKPDREQGFRESWETFHRDGEAREDRDSQEDEIARPPPRPNEPIRVAVADVCSWNLLLLSSASQVVNASRRHASEPTTITSSGHVSRISRRSSTDCPIPVITVHRSKRLTRLFRSRTWRPGRCRRTVMASRTSLRA